MLKSASGSKNLISSLSTCSRFLSKIKRSEYKFPELHDEELTMQIVSGSGPGGQKVNTSRNCVILKHIPTGIIVRVHESRSLEENRIIARERMVLRLDKHINGENCFEALKQRERMKKSKRAELRAAEKRELKLKYKFLDQEMSAEPNATDTSDVI